MVGINLHLCAHDMRLASRIERCCRVAAATGLVGSVEVVGLQSEETSVTEMRDGWSIVRCLRWPRTGGSVIRKCLRIATWSIAVVCHANWRNLRCTSAHSVTTLPLAILLRSLSGCRVIYDTHELETACPTGKAHQIIFRLIERLLIRRVDAVVVVSNSIADWYAREYGIQRPSVVRNIPDISGSAPNPQPNLWRSRLGIGHDEMIFIYQGKLTRGRRIEQLLRVFAQSHSDKHLVLMGFGDLTDLAIEAARANRNIHFVPAVPPADVLLHTAGADVGIHGGENICLSYYYSLPNKFFEYLWGGIGVLVPDWPEVASIVRAEKVGWVVAGETDRDWLEAINSLSWEDVRRAKCAARTAAPKYSWQQEARILGEVYRSAPGMPQNRN